VAEAAEIQGIPTAPVRGSSAMSRRLGPLRRRLTPRLPLRTASVLLAVTPIVGALLPVPTANAAGAAQAAPQGAAAGAAPGAAPAAARGTGSHTTEVSLNTLSPTAPQKGDTLTVTGTVTNNGAATLAGGRVGLRVGPALGSRSSLEQAFKHPSHLSGAGGLAVHNKDAMAQIGTMRPGARRPFKLKVPVSELHLGSSGAYQLGVTMTGKTRRHPYDQLLGTARSVLPWQTSDAQKKTSLTYLWPLVSTSHMTARTQSDEQQTPVFRSDSLAKELAPGGRLQQMVELGKDLPVSWVIDPDLLATVDAMTKRYRVQTADGGTKPGHGQAIAKKWLLDLQHAVKSKQVVSLPFADPDLASLAHHGRNVPGALSHLRPATQLGADTISTILHVNPTTDYAWPYDGAVDPSIVDVATSAGAHYVIARGDSLGDPQLPYAPTAVRPIGHGRTAMVADTGLSRAFEGDMSKPGATSRAVEHFLADTQAVTEQTPTRQRSVLVAPQRMPSTSQVQAMAFALSSLKKSGRWTQSSSLAQAAKAAPDPRANHRVPSGARYPASLRRQEVPTQAYERVRHTRGTLADFQQILTQDYRVVTPFGSSLEREFSNSWRENTKAGEKFRKSVQGYLVGLTKKVKLIQKSPITLSGRSATIPVTVQNNLVQGIDGLELRLTSSRRIGLDVGQPQPVRVDGGHSQSVKFPTTAKANGRSYVVAQLYTKDGRPYGKPMRFKVNVTSITSTVLLVIAGGVLLVVLAGVRMYTTRKRKGDSAADPDPDAPLVTPEAADGEEDKGGGDGEGGEGAEGHGGANRDGDGGGGIGRSALSAADGARGRSPMDTEGAENAPDAKDTPGGLGGDRGTHHPGIGGPGQRPGAYDTGQESGNPPVAGEKVDR
jgi:hypothetical protein